MKYVLALSLVLSVRIARADDGPSDADLKKWLAFIDKLADTAVADKDSCAKMGPDLNALLDKNADMIELAKKAKESGKKLPADAQTHAQEAFKRMVPALMNCKDDAGVKKAMERLQLSGGRKK
jgi:hypothetical protein